MPIKKGQHIGKATEFNSETSYKAMLKGLKTRRTNAALVKMIDDNYAAVLDILSKNTEEEVKKAVAESKDMPLMLKIYLADIDKQNVRRFVMEQIIDRVKGKPKQQAEVKLDQTAKFIVETVTKDQASEVEKALKD